MMFDNQNTLFTNVTATAPSSYPVTKTQVASRSFHVLLTCSNLNTLDQIIHTMTWSIFYIIDAWTWSTSNYPSQFRWYEQHRGYIWNANYSLYTIAVIVQVTTLSPGRCQSVIAKKSIEAASTPMEWTALPIGLADATPSIIASPTPYRGVRLIGI